MTSSDHAILSEVELLMCVANAVPASIQARYSELIEQRQAEELTPDEQRELLNLTEQIEQIDAQRAEHLAALAQIRRVPIAQLLSDLGIDKPVQHG